MLECKLLERPVGARNARCILLFLRLHGFFDAVKRKVIHDLEVLDSSKLRSPEPSLSNSSITSFTSVGGTPHDISIKPISAMESLPELSESMVSKTICAVVAGNIVSN